jgi:hypothetical protein
MSSGTTIRSELKELFEQNLEDYNYSVGEFTTAIEHDDLIYGLVQAKYYALTNYNNFYYQNKHLLSLNHPDLKLYEENKSKLITEIRKNEDRAVLINTEKCSTHCRDSLKKLNIVVTCLYNLSSIRK